MKKIVQITPFYWPHLGGVETHVKELNRELIKRDYQITVLTSQHEVNLPLQAVFEQVKIKRLPKLALYQKLATWKWVWQQRQVLLEADIIQIHDVVWWLYPMILFLRSKTFATFHGWEGIYPIPWKNKLQRRFNSWLVKKRLHIGAWIEEFYGDKPDEVVYGGVNVATMPKITKNQSKEIRCVFLGRLEAVNDLPAYLELFQHLLRSDLPVSIIWVGEGSYRLPCQAYGKVTGMIENPQDMIAKADVVFANSYLSIIEAQAQGKVVVALYANALKKAYLEAFPGKDKMLITPDATLAAQQITLLYKDQKKLNLLSQKAVKFANSQTWKKVADVYEKMWVL